MSNTTTVSPWNSLEIAKLILGFLTPLLVGVGVFLITKSMHSLEKRSIVSQKVIERRLTLFDTMAPLLNDLYCYFVRVGGWKELNPPALIDKKRTLDRSFYVNKALFSPEFQEKYVAFLDDCFHVFSGHAKNARLRTHAEEYVGLPNWNENWRHSFVNTKSHICPLDRFAADYEALMHQFAVEVGVGNKLS